MTQREATFTEEESSLVREAKYDTETGFLELRLDQGSDKKDRFYFYEDVPEFVYDELLVADSHGSYFNDHIKGVYDPVEA